MAPQLHHPTDHVDFLRVGGDLDLLLEYERDQPSPDDFSALTTPTLRTILRTLPTGRCSLGKAINLTHLSEGWAQNAYKLCGRAACANCAPGYLRRHITRALHVWRDRPIRRIVFLSEEAWQSRRGRAFRAEYSGQYVRVATGYDGASEVFYPAYSGEGEPVDDAPGALYAALLRAPTGIKGKRIITNVKLTSGGSTNAERDPDEEPTLRQIILPSLVNQHTLMALYPASLGIRVQGQQTILGQWDGVKVANAVCEATLGRPVEWERIKRKSHYITWHVGGLSPDEVRAIRTALEPLRQLALEEARQRRAAYAMGAA
jgi:hypothetical protein